MSYSFTVKAETKADAKAEVERQFDLVVAGQPIHKADREAVLAAIAGFVDIIGEPNLADEISIGVSGSLSWNGPMENEDYTGTSVHISARILNK